MASIKMSNFAAVYGNTGILKIAMVFQPSAGNELAGGWMARVAAVYAAARAAAVCSQAWGGIGDVLQ